MEFFVSSAEQYDCHLLLLPELFTAQLFATLPRDATDAESIGWLADQTPRYQELFRTEAKRSGIMIAAGSHPVRSPTGIRNVAHLFTPAGNVYTQEKLHITPTERDAYGIVPGDGLQVFDTAFGRIAIVICYDIEFPELTRLLTLSGVEIVLVPFSTDERKGYLRVRYSAQARAVENMVYVAISGNVGNLPQVDNFLLNYAQAAVLTPSDFPFPTDARRGDRRAPGRDGRDHRSRSRRPRAGARGRDRGADPRSPDRSLLPGLEGAGRGRSCDLRRG